MTSLTHLPRNLNTAQEDRKRKNLNAFRKFSTSWRCWRARGTFKGIFYSRTIVICYWFPFCGNSVSCLENISLSCLSGEWMEGDLWCCCESWLVQRWTIYDPIFAVVFNFTLLPLTQFTSVLDLETLNIINNETLFRLGRKTFPMTSVVFKRLGMMEWHQLKKVK